MPADLRSSTHGQTMVLTLHNPEFRNALDPAMYAAGVEALNAAGDNPEVRSVILVGEGDTFCAGGNLQRLLAGREGPAAAQAESVDALHSWIDTIATFPKPVIAAVEGAAAGAGFSLALACDFIVASREAIFALSHARVGLTPDGGATWHLARSLPRQAANEIALLGGRVGAERLQVLGLVNRLSAPGDALADALPLAQSLNERAPNAVAGTKELLTLASQQSLPGHLVAERDLFVAALRHPNAGIGINAFLHKQAPAFD
ncbi:oxepin-CoA hydrolase, alternative type [Xylophilus sp. GOD-11R]|uniref:oxepin-CoA hydrolase, alternative type n=1 Tax=Xylophilus sp. GOD-11R TaxID=3089814 RepID=UPI00298CF615|nr:enoyl-CoA hydratase [Xylophilus sp. GOD-11R]WPB58213.1 enoyl-CoA hydratase [Xylophilus sp. GOD-11R]